MEDLAREISLCLRYYSVTFRGHRPNRVRLVGGEANDPQLQSILNTALPIPAEAGRLMSSVKLDRMKPADRRGSLSEWSVALGLGLKMTTGRFGSREGTPREAGAARGDSPMPQAEVVDLNRAINRGADPVKVEPVKVESVKDTPVPAVVPKPEVLHA